jgi:hypothetical protein
MTGLDPDRAWFHANPGRRHRVRRPMPGEIPAGSPPPFGFQWVITVRIVGVDGLHKKPRLWLCPPESLNEVSARRLWDRPLQAGQQV